MFSCGMLDALAFLPVSEVPDGMQYIRSQISAFSVATELTELVAYFDATYVTGHVRSVHRPDDGALCVRLRRSAPTFPPPVWNVNTETLAYGDRTNNLAETWNKAFAVLVGHSHPSVLVTVEAFQADLALAEQMIDLDARGQPPVKRVRRSMVWYGILGFNVPLDTV